MYYWQNSSSKKASLQENLHSHHELVSSYKNMAEKPSLVRIDVEKELEEDDSSTIFVNTIIIHK